ncbi:response regulator transcription factor [Streptosporangiaceae bacterium NEAU-GS5]|nr:response regulator transcription factor [Streptosporangiaceae bacterium NEAU-GS5]
MIRVAIVDDHPIARRGLAAFLAEAGDVTVTESVATPFDLAVWPSNEVPDLVLLDLYPGGGQQPCLTVIEALRLTTKVLIVSASGRPTDVVDAIRAGACGYVTKDADPAMLVAAVRTVAAGGFALSPSLADILQSRLPEPQVVPLSVREEQTLELIAQGLTHTQVATRMGVSKATVDTYLERIRSKLQVGNKAELTRAALERLGHDRRTPPV